MMCFLKCERGDPVIEFALLAPVLLLYMVGTVEVGSMIKGKRHLDQATQVAANLAAQVTVIAATPTKTPSAAEIASIKAAAQAMMSPADGSKLKVTVTGVKKNASGSIVVAWSKGDTPLTVNTSIRLPAGVNPPTVMAQTKYVWTPVLNLAAIYSTSTFVFQKSGYKATP